MGTVDRDGAVSYMFPLPEGDAPVRAAPSPDIASLRPSLAPPLGSFNLLIKSVAGAAAAGPCATCGVSVDVSVPLIVSLPAAARALAAASLPTPPYPEAVSVVLAPAPLIPSHC